MPFLGERGGPKSTRLAVNFVVLGEKILENSSTKSKIRGSFEEDFRPIIGYPLPLFLNSRLSASILRKAAKPRLSQLPFHFQQLLPWHGQASSAVRLNSTPFFEVY